MKDKVSQFQKPSEKLVEELKLTRVDKLEATLTNEQFTNRLRKRVDLLSEAFRNSYTEDESDDLDDQYDH